MPFDVRLKRAKRRRCGPAEVYLANSTPGDVYLQFRPAGSPDSQPGRPLPRRNTFGYSETQVPSPGPGVWRSVFLSGDQTMTSRKDSVSSCSCGCAGGRTDLRRRVHRQMRRIFVIVGLGAALAALAPPALASTSQESMMQDDDFLLFSGSGRRDRHPRRCARWARTRSECSSIGTPWPRRRRPPSAGRGSMAPARPRIRRTCAAPLRRRRAHGHGRGLT